MAPLHLAIENYLYIRGGLLNFFHNYVRDAVEHRYLPTNKEKQEMHIALAAYFDSEHEISPRKLVELPWHLQEAGEWHRLYSLLSDTEFFIQLMRHNDNDVFAYWAAIEKKHKYDQSPSL